MRYLALDQALVTSGWAIFDDDKLIDFGHFNVPANKPIEHRLYLVMQNITELKNKFNFQKVLFEDIQSQQNKETYKKLAYVQATILLWCYMEEYHFSILSPSHWRSILKDKYKVTFGRSRAEQKKAAQQLVRQVLQIEATEDECDAICIGLAGIQEQKKKESAW